MRPTVRALLLAAILTCQAFAALVTISDTIYNADGTKATGTLTLTWKSFDSLTGVTIVGNQLRRPFVTGAISLALEPNPSGTFYAVQYDIVTRTTPARTTSYAETWIVPTGGPYKIQDVRTSVLPTTQTTLLLDQLSTAGAGKGDLIAFSTKWQRFPKCAAGQIVLWDTSQATGIKCGSAGGDLCGTSAYPNPLVCGVTGGGAGIAIPVGLDVVLTPGLTNGGLFYKADGAKPPDRSAAFGFSGPAAEFKAGPGGGNTITTTGGGGFGGVIDIVGGDGGAAENAVTQSTGGDGGLVTLLGGAGGYADVAGGANKGGTCGGVSLNAGYGGNATNGSVSNTGGDGCNIDLFNGWGGTGATANGIDGTTAVHQGGRGNADIFITTTSAFAFKGIKVDKDGVVSFSVGGGSGKAVCWKTATTLGFCSTIVGADGSCTCN